MSETNKQKVALITGANKGIGFETARQLAGQDIRVLLGARDEQRGRDAAKQLQRDGLDDEFIRLDMNDEATHQAAQQSIAKDFGKLDILVNNAGVALDLGVQPSAVSMPTVRQTFETNFFGAVSVTLALLPLLRKSDAGRIVNVSSGLGSLTQNSDPKWEYYPFKLLAYNTSKTALNAFTVMLAYDLKDTAIKINSADPGYTATDMNAHQGNKTVGEGAEIIVRLATLPADGPTGGYFNDRGPVPW